MKPSQESDLSFSSWEVSGGVRFLIAVRTMPRNKFRGENGAIGPASRISFRHSRADHIQSFADSPHAPCSQATAQAPIREPISTRVML